MSLPAAAALLASAIAAVAAVADTGFSRYQPILDRRPFGASAFLDGEEGASGLLPSPPPIPAGPSFADSLQLCALTQRGDRLLVGFVDNSQKPPVPYFMYVGESEDGYEILDAEYQAERVRIRKGAEEHWIGMGGALTASAAPATAATVSGAPSPIAARRTRPSSSRITPGLSREEYLRQRREGLRSAPQSPRVTLPASPVQDPSEEERRADIRQYNLNLIRAGGTLGPALPIELTPEEDSQLVSEGVLPPPEQD